MSGHSGFGADLWAGWGSGSAPKTAFYAEYLGEGAYAGLVYRVWGA